MQKVGTYDDGSGTGLRWPESGRTIRTPVQGSEVDTQGLYYTTWSSNETYSWGQFQDIYLAPSLTSCLSYGLVRVCPSLQTSKPEIQYNQDILYIGKHKCNC